MGSECTKCGSAEIVSGVAVHGHHRSGGAYQVDIFAAVFRRPTAFLFKGMSSHRLRARVCGRCGFTELYADSPQDLYRLASEQAKD